MKIFVIVAVILPASLAIPIDERIVGGKPARVGQFPYQISMQSYGQHFCGGSIISADVILTAAHCVYQNSRPITIVAGITNLGEQGVQVPVATVIYHEHYDPDRTLNDVAILKLARPLRLGGNIQAVGLRGNTAVEGEVLTLSGWGLTSYPGGIPTKLQWMQMKALDLYTCAGLLVGASPISTGHVCTTSPSGQGACQGDSGGPLVDGNGEQVGIVSWGIPCATGYPDVFTSVAFYGKWISSH